MNKRNNITLDIVFIMNCEAPMDFQNATCDLKDALLLSGPMLSFAQAHGVLLVEKHTQSYSSVCNLVAANRYPDSVWKG